MTDDSLEIKKVLVTGSAGFIGSLFARKLLQHNIAVVGLDNLTPNYDPDLKKARLVLYDSVGAGMTRSSFLLQK